MYEGGKKSLHVGHPKVVWVDYRGGHELGLWTFQVRLEFPGAFEIKSDKMELNLSTRLEVFKYF